MPRRVCSKKLQLFSLHVRNGDEEVDYGDFFDMVESVPESQRKHLAFGRMVVFGRLDRDENRVWIHAYEGDPEVDPLIFNHESMKQRTGRLGDSDLLANKTHCLIDFATRECVVEYSQRGAKYMDIADLLAALAHQFEGFEAATVDFSPIATGSFIDQLNRFGRIRVGRVKLNRPNSDWTDQKNKLTEAADASNGHTVELVVTAEPKRSLSKVSGIVDYIRRAASEPRSILRSASVDGIREGEDALTRISLSNFVEHQRVNVKLHATGHVDDEDVENQMAHYLNSRRH